MDMMLLERNVILNIEITFLAELECPKNKECLTIDN